jgi:hypothetical protein
MLNFEYEFRPKLIFGAGTVKSRLGGIVKSFNTSKVAIVTDKGIVGAGLLKDVQDALDEAGIKYIVFDEVEPNPRNTTCDRGAKIIDDCNFLIYSPSSIDKQQMPGNKIRCFSSKENCRTDYILRYPQSAKGDLLNFLLFPYRIAP